MVFRIVSDTEYGQLVTSAEGVVARAGVAVWDHADREFPLSPLECWYLLRGYSISPKIDVGGWFVPLYCGALEGGGEPDAFVQLRRVHAR